MFDCDGTLIKGDIGESMLYHQLENFLVRVSPAMIWPDHPKGEELSNLYESLSDLPADKAIHDRRFTSLADMMLGWYFDQLAEGKTRKACSDIVRLFTGFTSADLQETARATLRKELGSPTGVWTLGTQVLPRGIRYIRETVDLLKLLQGRGFEIWVISGSNRWSVEAVCEPLGVRPDRIIGIDLVDEGGVLTDEIKEPVPVLDGKVAALRERVAGKPLIVTSDSTYDIPLFNYSSGLRILVHSTNDQDFFKVGKITRNETWIVFESPSLMEQNAWPMQQ